MYFHVYRAILAPSVSTRARCWRAARACSRRPFSLKRNKAYCESLMRPLDSIGISKLPISLLLVLPFSLPTTA